MSVKCDVKVLVVDNEATHLDIVQIIPCYRDKSSATTYNTSHWTVDWTFANVIKLQYQPGPLGTQECLLL